MNVQNINIMNNKRKPLDLLLTSALLEDLEVLTDPSSIYYDADISAEKMIIKKRILSGEISDTESDYIIKN